MRPALKYLLVTALLLVTTALWGMSGLDIVSDVFSWIGKVLKWILTIGGILLIIAFREEIVTVLLVCVVCYFIGGAITYFIFDNYEVGGWIGVALALIWLFRLFVGKIDFNFDWDWGDFGIVGDIFCKLMGLLYFLVSLGPFFLNRLQHFLSSPWRYFIKRNMFSSRTRAFLRPFFGILTVPLYIALTPLRLVNAIYYNIFVHGLAGLYDLMCEVFVPSCWDEGEDRGFWIWLLWFPVRFFKYFVFHGIIVLLESVLWTAIDVIIPAVTLYHGTDLTAGQCIVGCCTRNEDMKYIMGSDYGTFRASDDSWAGIGVYFASWRWVANSYAKHRKLSDDNPVTIVCRVSLGKTLNIDTAPWIVEDAIGRNGNPAILNRYAEKNGYVTGEWYNGNYWEYCLFDWQNLYNERWRNRPLYLYNHRTNMIQHVKGGMAHWLLDI